MTTNPITPDRLAEAMQSCVNELNNIIKLVENSDLPTGQKMKTTVALYKSVGYTFEALMSMNNLDT